MRRAVVPSHCRCGALLEEMETAMVARAGRLVVEWSTQVFACGAKWSTRGAGEWVECPKAGGG